MHKQASEDWLIGPRPSLWWTGLEPRQGLCPGVDREGVLRSLPQLRFKNVTRTDILDYFNNTWALTENLFSALQGEEAFTRPPAHQLRHPLAFYYGHPAVLYVNKLRVAGLLKEPVNAHFESLLEAGVDEMSWDDMSKNEMRWPAIREITEYRRTVYKLIRHLILEHPELDPARFPISMESPAWALVMGFEHERIHFETSSVLMRELPLRFLVQPKAWPRDEVAVRSSAAPSKPVPMNSAGAVWPKIAKGQVVVGKPAEVPTFGWDNEYGRREMTVPDFYVSPTLVTNGEYIKFVSDGGYREPRFWSKTGWEWRSFANSKAPLFWVPEGPSGLHKYKIRRIFDLVDFQPDWPAIVNFHEAAAYTNWKNTKENAGPWLRLISEAEHHRLRELASAASNTGLLHGSEVSVARYAANGLSDIFGNVWQWCADEFNPLPGFRVHPFYEDFSTPCFDGQHQMMIGGSFASTGDEAEAYARFHFRPHFFQHAGFRLVRSADANDVSTAIRTNLQSAANGSDYESSELLSQYLLLHFAEPEAVFSFASGPKEALDFPQRCAAIVVETAKEQNVRLEKVLDLGCAVGGASFALSQNCSTVTGIDLSTSFIGAARHLQAAGEIEFERKDQGEIRTRLVARRPKDSRAERIEFHTGDACKLDEKFKNFDAVLMANLLCRLPDPKACLEAMGGARSVVRPGGLLFLFSPYSWLPQHTPQTDWLGGQLENGRPLFSEEKIQQVLGSDFQMVRSDDVPVLIREHARKYQYIVSHLMIFRRTTK